MVKSFTNHLPVSPALPAVATGDLLQAWHDGSRAAYDRSFDLVLRIPAGRHRGGAARPARLAARTPDSPDV